MTTLTLDRRAIRFLFNEKIVNAIDALTRTEPPFAPVGYTTDNVIDQRGAVIDIERYFGTDWSQYPTIEEAFGRSR